MKKLLFFVLIMFIANLSFAQENEIDKRKSMQFGLKAGINISNLYNTEVKDFEADSKLGFSGVHLVTIPIGVYFGVQPELMFSQKGYKATGSIFGYYIYNNI